MARLLDSLKLINTRHPVSRKYEILRITAMAGLARGRFASLTDEEFNYLIKSKDVDNTIKATKNAVGIFRACDLKEKNLSERFEPGFEDL